MPCRPRRDRSYDIRSTVSRPTGIDDRCCRRPSSVIGHWQTRWSPRYYSFDLTLQIPRLFVVSAYSASLKMVVYIQGGPKKLHTVLKAITLSTLKHFFIILAHIHYRKFATGWCIVRPPNTVYVPTLPCKNLNRNFTAVLHIYYR